MRSALLAALVLALGSAFAERAQAQLVYVTGYAPAPAVVVAPAPVVTYRPVRPVAVTAFSPVVAPAPIAVAPAPTIVARPVVAAPVAVAAPVVTTRWRPILGGTVSRVRYRYAPAVLAY